MSYGRLFCIKENNHRTVVVRYDCSMGDQERYSGSQRSVGVSSRSKRRGGVVCGAAMTGCSCCSLGIGRSFGGTSSKGIPSGFSLSSSRISMSSSGSSLSSSRSHCVSASLGRFMTRASAMFSCCLLHKLKASSIRARVMTVIVTSFSYYIVFIVY